MSGTNFNITTQQAATKNPSVIDVYNAAQMPLTLAADGVMRFKPELSTNYILHPGVILPKLEIPIFSNPSIPQAVEFTAAVQGQPIPIAGSSNIPHIWGRNINNLVLRNIILVDLTPQTTSLFDLVGGTPLSNLVLNNSPLLNFKEIGNVLDVGLIMPDMIFLNFERGLVSTNIGSFLSTPTSGRIANLTGVTTQSSALCFMGNQSTVGINANNIQINSSDSFVCIDSAATGIYDIIGNSYNGVGDFFAPDISNAITAFTNIDVTIDSFSNSVANPGTHTDLNFTPNMASIIKVGQTILIADEVAYDGLHVVTKVYDDQKSVEIAVVHSTSASGILKRTQVTSVDHKLVRDQTNTISITTNYNGTTNISQIIDDDKFIIPVAFVADDAIGFVAATSKNSRDIGVNSLANGFQENSTVSAELNLSGNTAVTSIPALGALVEINLNQDWIATDVERLTVTTDGVVRLDDLKNIKLKIDGNINLEPATASKSISVQAILLTPPPITVTFTNGTNIVNETATARVNGDLVSFRDTVGTLPSEIRDDIVYYVVNQTANTFQVSYTLGGSVVTFTDDGTPINSYQFCELHGSKPTNTISAGSSRDLIPQATVPATPLSKSFIVVTNNDDAVDIQVNNGYQRYFE